MDNVWYIALPLAFIVCVFSLLVLLVTRRESFNLRVSGLGVKIELSNSTDQQRRSIYEVDEEEA